MNIEQQLDDFLNELQHTYGPWKAGRTPFYLKAGQKGEPLTIRSPHHTEEIATVWTCALPTEANSKLITRSPDMLRTLCRTYLMLLIKFAWGQNSTCNEINISLQSTLADLRNAICNATGLECQYVQEKFEGYVMELR
jgi:hypothetical protein